MSKQTLFLPDVAPPTTRELIEHLLVKGSGTKPGGDLMPLFMGVCRLGDKAMMLLTGGE